MFYFHTGWGQSNTHTKDTYTFLGSFLAAVKVDRPVLVPASMGGAYALPYLMGSKPATCHTRVRGFVPIAIVATDKYKPSQYHQCHVSI